MCRNYTCSFFKLSNYYHPFIFVLTLNMIGELDYEVYVYTSDILNAGTDANVVLRIHGELGSSELVPLVKSKTHRNKFERANTDRFTVRALYLGDIRSIEYS